jgi:hypothetical protein
VRVYCEFTLSDAIEAIDWANKDAAPEDRIPNPVRSAGILASMADEHTLAEHCEIYEHNIEPEDFLGWLIEEGLNRE